jgi:flavin-binding protein dodecin
MALERASDELDNIIYDNTQQRLGNVVEGALSEQQRIDPYDNKEYNPNDPRNW